MAGSTKRIVTVFLVVAIAAIFTGPGFADLPPPPWMPGFPLMAGTRLMLMWGPVPGAVRYKVVANGRTIAETASYQYFMQAPEAAGECRITVVAIDAEGKEGPPSREWVTRIDKLAPPATVFFRVMDSGAVSLRWEPVPGAVVYNVFKREGAQGENKPLASVLDIAYPDSAVKKDTEVFYTVSAKDAAGRESGLSDPIKVVVASRGKQMATAFQDLVPITSTVVKRIRNFDLEGKRIPVRNPGGVAEHGGNFYYTEILSGKVYVLERESYGGVRVFGGAENDEWAIQRAIGIEVDRNGNLYIADAFGGKIVKYGPDGKFLKNIFLPAHTQERMGREETRDAGPIDLRVLDDGTLAVVDNSGSRILLLDGNGRVLKALHRFTDGKTTAGLKRPTAIDVDSGTGDLYIADALNNRIVVVDKDGKFLRTIGEPGDIVGTFSGLLGLALDRKRGWVVAVDGRGSNLQIFDMKTGKYLYSVAGEKPDAPIEISKPQKIRRLSDGSFILTEGLVDKNGGGLLEFRVADPGAPASGKK
jgi:sugar lactone lactonase YvrE